MKQVRVFIDRLPELVGALVEWTKTFAELE
jgi:hypothetical protein